MSLELVKVFVDFKSVTSTGSIIVNKSNFDYKFGNSSALKAVAVGDMFLGVEDNFRCNLEVIDITNSNYEMALHFDTWREKQDIADSEAQGEEEKSYVKMDW